MTRLGEYRCSGYKSSDQGIMSLPEEWFLTISEKISSIKVVSQHVSPIDNRKVLVNPRVRIGQQSLCVKDPYGISMALVNRVYETI